MTTRGGVNAYSVIKLERVTFWLWGMTADDCFTGFMRFGLKDCAAIR